MAARSCSSSVVFVGDPADADDVLAPFRQLATPLVDMSGTMPYLAVQSAFDPLLPDGGRYYFKSHFVDELSDEALPALVACSGARPNLESLIVIRTLGGAIARVSADDSAYPHRDARFNVSIDGIWSTRPTTPPSSAGLVTRGPRCRRFSNGAVYVNFAGFEGEHDVTPTETFGPNLARLERIRSEYDPDRLFAAAARRP